MSDRTNVYLTVLNVHAIEAEKIFNNEADDFEKRLVDTIFTFEDIKYGTLAFLDILTDAGIPYDSAWCQGSGYGEGTQSCRFTSEGEAIVKTVYLSAHNIPLEELLPLLDDSPALVACIKSWHEDTVVLPWERQEEYSKIFRTKKLINA